MVNWNDPQELIALNATFINVIYLFFGLFVWEIIMTWNFDWSIITRKRPFKWPLVFYFQSRYAMLLALIGLIISNSLHTKINCNALETFNNVMGNLVPLGASTSLMLRTIAIWDRKLFIVVPLVMLSLGQWAMLIRGMFLLETQWDGTTCVITKSNSTLLKVIYFYTMGFDLIVLVATTTALFSKHGGRSGLWKILFRDGLVYFIITFCANCVPAVLNVLELNQIMDIIAAIPAATISAVASCRVIVRLLNYGHLGASSGAAVSSSTGERRDLGFRPKPLPGAFRHGPEIQVKTEQITMADFDDQTESIPDKRAEAYGESEIFGHNAV